jgi:hypothetical protein
MECMDAEKQVFRWNEEAAYPVFAAKARAYGDCR